MHPILGKISVQVDVMPNCESFMVGVKTVLLNCEWQSEDEANKVQVFVDSKWAGFCCHEAFGLRRDRGIWKPQHAEGCNSRQWA